MLISIVFFALRSVVLNFVIFSVNQIAYKHKFIPLVFKGFKDSRQGFGCVVSIVVKQHNRTVFNLLDNPVTNALRRSVFLPVKAVTIRYKSKKFFTKSLKRLLLHNMSQYVKICMVLLHP